MYGIHGERRLPELELPWLKGYENSAPVRIGNGAAGQLQLDVWGEVLDCLSLTRNSLLEHTDDAWDVQVALWNISRQPGAGRTTGCGKCAARSAISRTPR